MSSSRSKRQTEELQQMTEELEALELQMAAVHLKVGKEAPAEAVECSTTDTSKQPAEQRTGGSDRQDVTRWSARGDQ